MKRYCILLMFAMPPLRSRFWQAEGYTVAGALKNSKLGNGLTCDRVISEVTGRVMAVASGIGAGTQAQFHEYTYDLLGQVTGRLDHMMGRDESYAYDGLNRLVHYNLSTVSPIVTGVPASTPAELTMQYDALGNLTHKSDAGVYYYAPGRPRAVASVYDATNTITRNYTYDANGNQTAGPGRSLEWSAANQVKKITGGGKSVEFLFGASRERIVQKNGDGTTTIYVGSMFEKVIHEGSGLVEEKYHIFTPLGRTATRTLRSDSLVETRYYHHDALGSIVAVIDEWGRVEKRFAYDPWGRREVSLDLRARNGGAVTRGFTDHEHLDDFGLIHMNGRIFDPALARFLPADPFIDDAGDSQSYNRYSYVNNNPLNATDPSGYFKLKDLFIAVVAIVVCIVVTIVTYGAGSGVWGVGMAAIASEAAAGAGVALAAVAAGGFAGAFVGALMGGASPKQAFRAGLAGAFTAVAGSVVGAIGRGITGKLDMFVFKVGAHGLAGGVAAEIGGGEFRHGFLSSAAAAGVDYSGLGRIGGKGVVAGTIRQGLVGGTVSAIGGGKFVNGAYTAALQHLVNQVATKTLSRRPNIGMSTSKAGLNMIAELEDFREDIYTDQAGNKTIGYGHKLKPGEASKYANGISQPDALTLLKNDLAVAESAVIRLTTISLEQYQFDALVSFTMNVGAGNFASSTMLQLLNASATTGNGIAVEREFSRWNKITVNGRKVASPGLEYRRWREVWVYENVYNPESFTKYPGIR